jgi:hypothetical protein
MHIKSKTYWRVLAVLLILFFAFAVRALTAQFMLPRLSDAQFFQPGSYAGFAGQAEKALDGHAPLFLARRG